MGFILNGKCELPELQEHDPDSGGMHPPVTSCFSTDVNSDIFSLVSVFLICFILFDFKMLL